MADLNYYFGPWQRDTEQQCWVPPSGTVGLIDWGSLNDCALSPSARDMRGIGLFCTPRALTLPSEYDLLDSGDCREIQVTTTHRDLVEAVLGVRIDAGGTLAEACAALFAAGDPTGQNRWKPLTPDRDGNYVIHLGGHSPIWNREFEGQAGPWWNKQRDLLRHDLDQHDKECKAEAARLRDEAKALRKQNGNGNGKKAEREKLADAMDERAAKVEFHAEKMLDAMCIKYRCLPSELSTTIRRGEASTTVTDNFSASLTGWTDIDGHSWSTEDVGGGNYRCGKTQSGGHFGRLRNDSDVSSADFYAQAVRYYDYKDTSAICCRFASAATTYYSYSDLYTTPGMFKTVAGSETFLAYGTSYTAASGDTWKCEGNGAAISGWAGSSTKSLTDSAISTGTRGGFAFKQKRDDIYNNLWDAYYATDGIPDGPTGSPYYAYAQQ